MKGSKVVSFEEKVEQKCSWAFCCWNCDCSVFFIYEDGTIECGRCNKFQNYEEANVSVRRWMTKIYPDETKSARILNLKKASNKEGAKDGKTNSEESQENP